MHQASPQNNKDIMQLKERLQRPPKQWIKCVVWSIIYVLFICWVYNFWWLLLLPVIFDLFITKFIPWTFWKKTRNKTLYSICSWIDAIVFALVAVYFINLYLFQNYQIPSSSLEKSLLVGDFLFVSKASYGPRIPNTPLSFPLVQNTFPQWLGSCKSYIEKPQWSYRRLRGWDSIQRNDIVVFNLPAGDSVPLLVNNPDYYTLAFEASYYSPLSTIAADSVIGWDEYQKRLAVGKAAIAQREQEMGRVVWRPVDRRENYVKRCIGLPGETIELRNNIVYINGQPIDDPEHVQYAYYVQTNGTAISSDALHKLDIRQDEAFEVNNPDLLAYVTCRKDSTGMAIGRVYRISLTNETRERVSKLPFVLSVTREPAFPNALATVFPLSYSQKWNRDNYGPLWLPKKGATIALTEDNLLRYERAIVAYEGNTLTWHDGRAWLNGQPADSYTFKMNYYWMMGDNRHNSADSRSWGYVPEDHIVGRPVFIWLSIDKEKGNIRWQRFFRDASK